MHRHSIDAFRHEHVFLGARHDENAKRVWAVVALTFGMMVAEIAGGTLFGSLALIADGWHMSTHAAALSISALAYYYASRHARDERFAFGTGKFGMLASFASAIVLGMIALLIGYESIGRLVNPVPIAYDEAIAIAAVGLVVNPVSAWLLGEDHDRAHHYHHENAAGHSHSHGHHHEHDLNLRSAYIHVLADALTSLLAIGGLSVAKLAGWAFMDPLVGLASTGVILSWAYGLLRRSSAVLIDAVPDRELAARIRAELEANGDAVSDLHLWHVGPGHFAAVIALVSADPKLPEVYKQKLAAFPKLSHVTVEIGLCPGHRQGRTC
ncbi:MAG TPA: CDF family Co(II)/Ni(II) efflux transporter DmeF [Hyphomicrobiales bacterium]|nr:CDF family Co(II)/Ni(II) efflux transporter DmeF [Hyphomicrobiales bacterium]